MTLEDIKLKYNKEISELIKIRDDKDCDAVERLKAAERIWDVLDFIIDLKKIK